MPTSSDKASQFITASIKFIFTKHPTRTTLGMILGIVIHILTKLFSPLLNRLSIINLSIISAWEYLVCGIFLMHLRTFYDALTKKTFLGENEEKAFELIRLSREQGRITEWEAQNFYVKLCEKVLANVELKESTKEEINQAVKQQT